MSTTFGPPLNFYFAAAGLLLFLLSFTHALWGERRIFNRLNISRREFLSLYVPWHQMTYILFLSGVGMILAALENGLLPLSYFVLALNLGNILVFTIVSLVRKETALIWQSVPQYLLFALLIIVLTAGIVAA